MIPNKNLHVKMSVFGLVTVTLFFLNMTLCEFTFLMELLSELVGQKKKDIHDF